jgi:enterochelin esterase-like enzyme
LIVDGVEMADTGSRAFFGGSKYASAVEVPEPGSTYYSIENVPHGQVREVWYFSRVTGTWRHALVYAPPGYDEKRPNAIRCSTCSTAAARTRPAGSGRATRTSSSIT